MSAIYGEGLALQVERIESDDAPAKANGMSAEVRKLPVRTTRVDLDGDYAGYWATMRLNPRRSTIDGLSSGETRPACEALAKLIVAWNVTDEEGRPLEVTPDEVYDLPDEMLAIVIRKYLDAVRAATDLPKAPADNSASI